MSDETVAIEGHGRLVPGGVSGPARLTFGESDFTVAIGVETRVAAYRDLATIAVQPGSTLLVLGDGAGADRIVMDQLGSRQGQLLRELRDRRLRQQLADALVDAPADPFPMVEYASGDERGVALLAYHPWGAVIAPVDESLAWIRVRRGEITSVAADETAGTVTVETAGSNRGSRFELQGLGADARLHRDRFLELRRAADEDAGRIIGLLLPDAAYGLRREAIAVLVDGRPARSVDLPTAWADVERGVLVSPTFAASYAALTLKAGGLTGERAIALAPVAPGGDEAKSWFFVPLPGNLVALELVSEGAHATYLFHVVPRAAFTGAAVSGPAVAAAVHEISEALVDSRFLREPMALPDDQLGQPRYLRYRMALRALPLLAAARARFVARIVHADDASWAAALDDLIAWHAGSRDDVDVWPGRGAQEAMVADAGTDDAGAPTGSGAAPAGDQRSSGTGGS